MVLPLIPVVAIAVGALTGGGGLALGGKGAHDLKKAHDKMNRARERYEARRGESEQCVARTNGALAAYGRQQKLAANGVVKRMADFLVRNERQFRQSEIPVIDGLEAPMAEILALSGIDVNAGSWAAGAVGSAAAAAGTSAGVTAAIGSFGVASTGAAISGLSGAAAQSATLAFLGGGSLAAGGGGVALGAAALNVVTAGPALLVGGFVVNGQGSKALTKADEMTAQVAVEIAKMDKFDAKLAAVDARVGELCSLLDHLTIRARSAMDVLESEPFDLDHHQGEFQRAMSLVRAVVEVVKTPVVDSECNLTDDARNLRIKYRGMADGESN